MADKDPIKERFSFTSKGSEEDSRVLWTATNDYLGREENLVETEQVAAINKNGAILATAQNSSLNTWRRIDAGLTMGTKPGMGMNPQRILENLSGLKKGDNVFWFDMENLGTHRGNAPDNLDWYMPTEIAIAHRKVSDKFMMVQGERGQISMLIKPTTEAETRISNLIGKAQMMMKNKNWQGLSKDERRTLNDLILYGSEDPFGKNGGKAIFETRNGITQVIGQNRLQQAPDNFLFQAHHLKAMERGFENLKKHGNSTQVVAQEMMNMFKGMNGKFKLGGFNIQNFDIPMMVDYLNGMVAPGLKSQSQSRKVQALAGMIGSAADIDTRQAVNVLNKDLASKFGPRLTQSDIASALPGLKVDMAHMGLADVLLNIEMHNKLVQEHGMMDIVNGKTHGLTAKWDSTPLKQGDHLFSMGGIANSQAGKFDAVYTKTNKGYQALYDKKMNPLFKNNLYSLHKEYNGVELGDGNKYFGVMLKNEDTGNFHFIARETKEELQNLIHQNLYSVDDVNTGRLTGSGDIAEDQARRKYLKMYSNEDGGGRKLINKMYSALDALDEARKMADEGEMWKHPLTGKEVKMTKAMEGEYVANATGVATQFTDKKTGKAMKYAATPEFMRDFMKLEHRLRDEKKYVQEFLSQLDKQIDPKNHQTSQNIALDHFRRLMDQNFGRNEVTKTMSNILPVTINHKRHAITGKVIQHDTFNIDLSTKNSIQRGISSVIRSGATSGSPTIQQKKQRLKRVINAARQRGPSGLIETERRALLEMVDKWDGRNSEYVLVNEIANRIDRQYQHHQGMGVNSITLENIKEVNSNRKQALADNWDATKSSIMNEAISRAKIYEQSGWLKDGGGLKIDKGSMLDQFVSTHNNAMKKLQKSAFEGSNIEAIDAKKTLERLINSASKDGFQAALVYDGKEKAMKIALAHEDVAKNVFKLAPNKILEDHRVATIPISLMNERQLISVGGQQKVAYSKIFNDMEGKAHLGTAFEESVSALSMRFNRARQMMKDGKVLEAEAMLRSAQRNALDNYSANNRYMSDEVEFSERKSAGSRFTRTQYLDVANFAAEWYEEVGGNKTIEKIRNKMTRENLSFFNAMDAATQRQFLSGVQPWARSKYGLKINMHSIKDTKAMNAVYSTEAGDVRHLIPFAHLNPTARENMPKAVNYIPLDAENSTSYLKSKGVSDDKIKRMMKRGLITEAADRFLLDENGMKETNWLNLRTAYVGQKDFADIINEKGGDHRMSVHDGGFVIADDVAAAFTHTRTRNIKLDPGEEPDQKIKDFFNQALADKKATVDADGNILMKKEFQGMMTLANLGLDVDPTTGKYTVGKMTKHLTTHGTVYLQGWNQNKGSLQVGEVELINTGTKMGTDSGDRITARIVPRKQFDDWGLGDVDAIMPEQEMKKSMHGSFIKSQVALVIDQAQEMIMKSDKVTVGGLSKEDAIQKAMISIENMMGKYLGTDGVMRLEDGQMIMNTQKLIKNGRSVSLDNVTDFMNEGDKFLNQLAGETGRTHVNNMSQRFRRGVEGFSRADVSEWHNSIGMTKGSTQGLVRYGYKEVDAYSRRADSILGKGNAVTGWLKSHIEHASKAQHQDIDTFYKKGVVRSVLDVTDESILSGRIKDGEVVIRTSGDAFSFNDREGVKAVRMNGGVAEVSMHAFNDLPARSHRGQLFTAGDYAKTVLDMNPVMKQITQDVDGNAVDLADIFKKNGGTALFEMPDESFSRKYVRFIDDQLFNIGTEEEGMGVLRELQKDKLSIFRNTKEYQANKNEETHAKLQQSINNYESTLARVVTSAKSGSIQDMRSARLDMSGRFNIQGVNPFVKNGYEEGTVYVGRERARQMIAGAEGLIADAVGLDTKGLDTKARNKKVLDYIASDGLYSFVNRYPTIAEDTGQVLKFKIDDSLDKEAKSLGFDHFKGGYFTVGTAVKMNADFDGDFFSAVLAQYKSVKGIDGANVNASEIHQKMQEIFEHDKADLDNAAAHVMNKLHDEARVQKTTVQDLWKSAEFRKNFVNDMSLKVGSVYDKETELARMGKANVGPLSNQGQTLLSMAETTFGELANAGRMSQKEAERYVDIIDQFGRAAEQKAISSKKFTAEALREEITKEMPGLNHIEMDQEIMRRMDMQQPAIEMLKQAMMRPDAAGQQMIREAQHVLGFLDNDKVDESLDALNKLYKAEGGGRAFQNRYQRVWGMSEGDKDIERVSRGLRGQMGEQGTFSKTADYLADYSETFSDAKETLAERHTRNILSNWDRMQGDNSTLSRVIDSADIKMTEHVLEGATMAERSSASLSSMVNKFTPALDGIGGGKGIVGGAVAFGAMWAASALMRSGPTPEQTEAVAPPPAPNSMPQPTARVVQGASSGEHINIRVNAKDANGMSQDQIAALVHQEISAMTSMPMNINMNVNDNTQNINQQWLQGIVANAVGKGYGF